MSIIQHFDHFFSDEENASRGTNNENHPIEIVDHELPNQTPNSQADDGQTTATTRENINSNQHFNDNSKITDNNSKQEFSAAVENDFEIINLDDDKNRIKQNSLNKNIDEDIGEASASLIVSNLQSKNENCNGIADIEEENINEDLAIDINNDSIRKLSEISKNLNSRNIESISRCANQIEIANNDDTQDNQCCSISSDSNIQSSGDEQFLVRGINDKHRLNVENHEPLPQHQLYQYRSFHEKHCLNEINPMEINISFDNNTNNEHISNATELTNSNNRNCLLSLQCNTNSAATIESLECNTQNSRVKMKTRLENEKENSET